MTIKYKKLFIGNKQTSDKIINIINGLEQSLDEDLKKINTAFSSLASLKYGENSDKQSAINDISERAQSMMAAIDKAKNKIDSRTIRYGHKSGHELDDENYEDDEPKGDDNDDGGHEAGRGRGQTFITSAQCKPSSLKPVFKLSIKFNAKAELSYFSYKIMISIANTFRKSDIIPPSAIIALIDQAYADSSGNFGTAILTLGPLIQCISKNELKQKLQNIIVKYNNQYVKIHEIQSKEFSDEYEEHSDDPNYCQSSGRASQIIIFKTQFAADISYFTILIKNKLALNPALNNVIDEFKKLSYSTDILLKKCGIKV